MKKFITHREPIKPTSELRYRVKKRRQKRRCRERPA
jgi:hypothetical protein